MMTPTPGVSAIKQGALRGGSESLDGVVRFFFVTKVERTTRTQRTGGPETGTVACVYTRCDWICTGYIRDASGHATDANGIPTLRGRYERPHPATRIAY